MLELLFCGNNLFCHFRGVNNTLTRPKYPPDVQQLCYYFEEQKAKLPEYCEWKSNMRPPRKRNEF